MNVVYCVTESFIEKIKPSIRSLREHHPKVKIYLVTEADHCDIENVKVIDIRDQQWILKSSPNYYNPYTYIGLLKVCYPTLLPCDKVIHLDADTIVADSLTEMWNTDLTGKWFGMVEEKNGSYRLPGFSKYYNAGVILLNLKQMRKDGYQDRAVEYINTVWQPYCEQDAFDKFGLEEDKIVPLDVRFNENQMTGFTDNPAIVHYVAIGDWWTNQNMGRVEYLNRYK